MSENQLIVTGQDKYNLDVFKNVATTTGGFLPYLFLASGKSKAVEKGLIPPSNWGLMTAKDTVVNLGKEVPVFSAAWRPKAARFTDPVLSYFTPGTEQFEKIKSEAENTKDSDCAYGPEFLVWLPDQKQFATYHMGSTTARNAAKDLYALLGKEAMLKFKLIENKKYTWLGPVIVPHSIPLSSYPDQDLLTAVSEKFLNPVDSTVELAPEMAESERSR